MAKSLLLICCLPLAVALGPVARRVSIRKSDKSWVQIKANAVTGVSAETNALSSAGAGHTSSTSSTKASFYLHLLKELEKRKKLLPRTEVKTNAGASSGVTAHATVTKAEGNANAKAHAAAGSVQLAASNKKTAYWLNIRKELEERKKLLPKTAVRTKSQVRQARKQMEKSPKHMPTTNLVIKSSAGAKKGAGHMMGAKANAVTLTDSARREMLWHSLSAFGAILLGTPCQIDSHTMYPDTSDIIYTKTAVPSALECTLMCAVDSVRGGGGKSCKSFVHNRTAKECHFLGSVPSGKADPCCSSGLPCALNGMRQDIQNAYEMNLHRKMGSQLLETTQESEPAAVAKEEFRPVHFADLTEGARESQEPLVIRPKKAEREIAVHNLSRLPSISIGWCVIVFLLVAVVVAMILNFEAALISLLGGKAEKYLQGQSASIKFKFEEFGNSSKAALQQVVEPLTSKIRQVPQAFTGISEKSKEFCATQAQSARAKMGELSGRLFAALMALRTRG